MSWLNTYISIHGSCRECNEAVCLSSLQLRLLLIIQHAGISAGETINTNSIGLGSIGTVLSVNWQCNTLLTSSFTSRKVSG